MYLKNEKRYFALILAAILCICFSACGKSQAAIDADNLISAIGTVDLNSGPAIEAAEKAVAALEDKDLEQIEYKQILAGARATYDELVKQAQIAKVEDAISAIGTVTLDSGNAIEAARNAYDESPSDIRKAVQNFSVLKDAEARLVTLQAAKEVSDLIAAIGTVTLDSGDAVKAARSAYDGAKSGVQSEVGNYGVLEAAETQLGNLKAQQVIDLIAQIGTVTLDSDDAIKAAENAYRTLTHSERALVTNADTMTSSRAAYKELKQAADRQAAIDEARSLFRVTRIWCSSHDSVGGVNVYFNFINNSDKVINYVNFGFTFYNAVGDVVKCEYEDATINRCYKTGPYAKGEGLSGYGWSWGKYYNWDIARVELVSLSLEYSDGTTYRFTDDQIAAVQY